MTAKDKFISLEPQVKNTDDIDDLLAYPFMHRYAFTRRTSPWEMSLWDQDELQRFFVDHNCIDRVYKLYCKHGDDGDEGDFSLIARMKYKNKHLFVSLEAKCDYSGLGCVYGTYAEIYVSFDVSIFYNTIICDLSNEERDLIFNQLRKDNYHITVLPDSGKSRVATWHNPPSLLFLCHEAVRHNKHRLTHYCDILPKAFVDGLDEFIKVKEAREDYDNC